MRYLIYIILFLLCHWIMTQLLNYSVRIDSDSLRYLFQGLSITGALTLYLTGGLLTQKIIRNL